MRIISNWIIFILICLVFMTLFSGCETTPNTDDFSDESINEYYEKEYFQSIIIGESTFHDIYNIAPAVSIQVASYGGFCEYPMQNGGFVRIKFYGKDLVVGDIEEISMSIETQ